MYMYDDYYYGSDDGCDYDDDGCGYDDDGCGDDGDSDAYINIKNLYDSLNRY